MALEQVVAEHYTHGSLERATFATLAGSDRRLDQLSPGDLAPVDQFHIGGRQATADFAAQMRARAAEGGPPPLGWHILMGASAPQKIANMIDNLERGLIAPTEIIGRAV